MTSVIWVRSTSATTCDDRTLMDWDAFRADIHLCTHFLDNIIDVNKYPLPEIDSLSKRIRRIGLGVMGFADALVRFGIAYDTRRRRGVRPQGDGVRRRRRQARVEPVGRRAWTVPRVGEEHLGTGRHLRARRERPAHSSDAAAAQLQRHDRRADRHDFHHCRMLIGPRAAVRRRVHAQPGRRDDARCERRLRRDRQERGLVFR